MKPQTDSPTSHLALMQSATAGAERHLDENAPERCLGMPQATQAASFAAKYGCLYPLDPSGGAFTVSLPPAGERGAKITFKNITASGNPVTVVPQSGETIDGTDSKALAAGGAWGIAVRLNRQAWAWLPGLGS